MIAVFITLPSESEIEFALPRDPFFPPLPLPPPPRPVVSGNMPTEFADACTVASSRLIPVVSVASFGPIRLRRFVFFPFDLNSM